jgi:SAM-dependent methyltransferase
MIYQLAKPRKCPVCSATVTTRFTRLKQVPVNCSALWHLEKSARAAARGDIELAFCARCGMIFNGAFDPARVDYGVTYDNTLSYSPVFCSYAKSLAERLVAAYNLRSKDIIEIGCGKGDFLDRLCQLGQNRGVGFDPSADNRNTPGLPVIVSRLFTRADFANGVDFICCRHVLEHLDSPRDLLAAVRLCLSERGGWVYCEVPDARWVLDGPSTWDLIYPHCSYFTAASLEYLFEESGFDVARTQSAFGGQFLGLEARVSKRKRSVSPEPKTAAASSRLAKNFDEKLASNIHRWSRFLEYASVEGCRVALWGAGTKGVTFLNVVPGAERIGAVVDLNPRKHGTFIPGTAQRVIPPEMLPAYRPDIVIVLNPIYDDEIRQSLSRLGIDPVVSLKAELPLAEKRQASSAVAV